MKDHYDFELLTPCFCYGASQAKTSQPEAEMRIPSIRGQLRRWHALLYGADDMKQTWGTAQGQVVSSRVILRLPLQGTASEPQMSQQVLPHVKNGGKAFCRNALKTGTHYRLLVSFRQMTSEQTRERVDQVIMNWLYLGRVGMRSTRAFGSIWPQAEKPDWNEFKKTVMIAGRKLAIAVSVRPLQKADLAICTDTLSGRINEKYFGYVHGRERLTSPLKMKYIRLADGLHLMLHAASGEIISGALKLLSEANKPLGKMEFRMISDGIRR